MVFSFVSSSHAEKEIRIRGRVITSADLELIRQLLRTEGHLGRTHLSQRLCRLWDFRQANGAYREIACRDLLRNWSNGA